MSALAKGIQLSRKKLEHNVTRSWLVDGDKEVVVLDGLFNRESIESIYQFLRPLQYVWRAYDREDRASFLRWKTEIPVDLHQAPFFSEIAALTGIWCEGESLRLDRVYANFNLFGELFFPHYDDTAGVTALYYANPVWKPRWQGETFFYEKGEPVHVVAPKPGRLILFDARIVHRGSAPSRECFEPRLNLAFKFVPASRQKEDRRPDRTKFKVIQDE